uniref:Uncharacterized protein n=1 Tax=Asparagus officinalis TaxID=4686 RepID=Q2AA32_ASPOF|nr:hypothetical protein 20.t00013 [Asparagus officinalis]
MSIGAVIKEYNIGWWILSPREFLPQKFLLLKAGILTIRLQGRTEDSDSKGTLANEMANGVSTHLHLSLSSPL